MWLHWLDFYDGRRKARGRHCASMCSCNGSPPTVQGRGGGWLVGGSGSGRRNFAGEGSFTGLGLHGLVFYVGRRKARGRPCASMCSCNGGSPTVQGGGGRCFKAARRRQTIVSRFCFGT